MFNAAQRSFELSRTNSAAIIPMNKKDITIPKSTASSNLYLLFTALVKLLTMKIVFGFGWIPSEQRCGDRPPRMSKPEAWVWCTIVKMHKYESSNIIEIFSRFRAYLRSGFSKIVHWRQLISAKGSIKIAISLEGCLCSTRLRLERIAFWRVYVMLQRSTRLENLQFAYQSRKLEPNSNGIWDLRLWHFFLFLKRYLHPWT